MPQTNSDYETTGYRLTFRSEIPAKWHEAINYLNQPAAVDKVAFEISRLRTLTAKRKEGEFDMELSIDAMTEELRIYPIDIVRRSCREWARKNVFFPVLKELLDDCEEHMALRRALLDASKQQPVALPSPNAKYSCVPEAEKPKPTPLQEAIKMLAMAKQNPTLLSVDEWQKRVDQLSPQPTQEAAE